jgi:hypothetical protein
VAQHGRNFFLNVNDQLGLAQLPAQSLDLTPQVFEFLVPGVACAFVAAFIVLEALEGTGLVLPSPLGQGRGIEAFSAQQGANLAGAGASLCLFDDAGLVSRCEPTSVLRGRYSDRGRRATHRCHLIHPPRQFMSPSLTVVVFLMAKPST